ncbi:hypothetical protein BDB00DRAFT_789417 [Zychaea mexicana]|uniref:uncharacterized protein n=1 Tax=Zychaea mexicana TaxID=64656 RepID=UPI0022FF20E8|nr:uncharacterized protein BDB00DRAFT_789417 [Zychaea mexicana]KAI9491586.1 hypothetical protein BDB00DRAFT_789417 [Zychaea mexicana]
MDSRVTLKALPGDVVEMLKPKQRNSFMNQVSILRKSRMIQNKLYREIRRDPHLLAALTHEDIEAVVGLFASYFPHANDQQSKMAAEILYDLSIHKPAQFSGQDAEMLVCFYAAYGETTQAEKTMQGLIYRKQVPSQRAYEALVHCLAVKGDMEGVAAWLKNMQANGLAPTQMAVRAIVDGWLRLGNEDKALETLKTLGKDSIDVVRNAIEQGQDDRAILNVGLKLFGHGAINAWLLEDARRFYQYLRERGLPTQMLVRHLVDKSLQTFQLAHAYKLLEDARACRDKNGTQLIGHKLLKYYLTRSNMTHAFRLWSQLSTVIEPNLCVELYMALAKTNRHEQLMRLYRAIKKRYPEHISIELYNAGLATFVRTKSYTYAFKLYHDMKNSKISPQDMPSGTFYSLYGLCAQTGRTQMFREVLETAAEAGMEMDNKALSSLMACYIKAGDIPAAKQVFEAIAESHGPDVVDFNLLIRATAEEQEENGVDFSKILKILQHMGKVQVEPDASTYRTLLDIYREGQIERQLFDRLLPDTNARKLDEVFVNNIALTRECERHGVDVAAAKFMNNDRAALFPGTPHVPILADSMTYKLLLDASAGRPKHMHVANRLYEKMRKKGWMPYRGVYERMILGWARKGRIQRARKLMREMEEDLNVEADLRIYTMLVDGLLLQNKSHAAIEVIGEMQTLGLEADLALLDRVERFEQDNYNKALAPA